MLTVKDIFIAREARTLREQGVNDERIIAEESERMWQLKQNAKQNAKIDFGRRERARLAAEGITDYDEQCAHIEHRWKLMAQQAPLAPLPAPSVVPHDTLVRFDFQLTPELAKASDLTYVGVSGSTYVYAKPPPRPSTPPPRPQATQPPPARRPTLYLPRVADALDRLHRETLKDACTDYGVTSSGTKGELITKLCFAMEVDARGNISRLRSPLTAPTTRLKKDTLQNMCDDLEVSPSGTKAELGQHIFDAFMKM